MAQPTVVLAVIGCLLLTVVTTFRRDNVEYRPPPLLPTSPRHAQLLAARPRFGSTALPLRQAVERVPSPSERAEEHFPIRDAVEQRPVLPKSPLGQWWNHRTAYHPPSPQQVAAVQQRVAPLAVSSKAVYCFVESWAAYRRAPMAFAADHIDPHLCSHLVYAFARLDQRTHRLAPNDQEYDIVKGGYRSVVFLKRLNPRLKVLLSVAGPFAAMTSSQHRRTFILSAVRLLHEYNFDGLDLHWQLPELEVTTPDEASPHSSTPPSTLAALLEEMSTVMEARSWTLTLSVSGSRFRANDAYPANIEQLASYVSHVLLKSYDLHEERGGGGEKHGGLAVHHAPLLAPPPTQDVLALYFNVDYAVRYWLKRGVPRHKLIMGIPLYARTYTLKDANQWQPGSPVLSGGAESRYTQQPGLLAYYEVCEKLVNGDDVSKTPSDDVTKEGSSDDVGKTAGDDVMTEAWRLFRDQGNAPFMVRGDQWVGYEDPLSIQTKMRYVNQQKLGGVMVWALDLDDFQGTYCGRKYPLLNAVNDHLHAYDWPLAVHQPPLAPPTSGLAPPTFAVAPPTSGLAPPTFAVAPPTSGLAPPTLQLAPPSNLEQQQEWSRKSSAGCSKGQFTAHPTNCNQYLQCQWGAYQIYSCPPGLHWSEKNNICDWPSRSTCRVTSPSNSAGGAGGSSKPAVVGGATPTKPPQWEWKPEATTEWSWTSPATSPKPIRQKPSKPTGKHPLSGHFKVVCYFTNWAWYRTGPAKYLPEDIDTNLCTHVLYGFAVLDFENLVIKAHDSWADFDNKFYERVVAMKKKGVHVLLAIGGWNDSQGDKYSRLVNSAAARQRFIQHVIPFLLKYDFDGLDLDWEYPKCWQVNCDKGPASDKESFGLFVKELKTAFRSHDLLLSAAVSPSKAVIDEGYDVKTMAEYLDWISVMTYDYHGQWDKKTGHLAPMYYHPEDDFDYFNANYSINYWVGEGVPRRKLVMGMPLYGQSFTLAKRQEHGLNAPAPGPGHAGESTRAAGFLAYYEICSRIKDGSWTVVQDEEKRMGPYAYKGDQWISFDDKDTIRRKSEWIRAMGLGGGMVWALDLDDFRNTCGGGKHPLLTIIAKTLAKPTSAGGITSSTTTTTTTEEPEPETEEAITTPPIHPQTTVGVSEPEKPPTTEAAQLPSSTTEEEPEEVEGTTEDELVEEETTTTSTTTTTTTTKRPRPSKPHKPKPKPKPKPTTTTTQKPKPEAEDHFKVVCYFTNWAWYRQGEGKYLPSDIDPELCTHIIYGFAVLDSDHLTIKPHDTWADFDNKFYEKVIAVKKKKANIRVLIAIGGWNDSAGDKYSRLVNSAAARQRFVTHVLQFIQEHGFDGLDLDWEYPKCWQVNCQQGPDSDKESFAAFVKELHEAFKPHGLLLSAAVSPSRTVITAGYEVKALSQYLDWISVMAYDYHGQWDKVTGHVAPMYAHPEDDDVTFNTNFTMHYWMRQGADRRKLIVGMPMYGQSFSLASTADNGLNAPTYGGGEAGEQTRARGFLAYYEICQRTLRQGWEVVRDEEGGRIGPYARLRDQWVSFDDQPMIAYKSNYVKQNNFGGAMIWALDLDDFRNLCGCEEYPLLKTINRVLRNYPGPQPECRLSPAEDGDNAESAITEFPERNNEVEGVAEMEPKCVNGVMAHPGDCGKYYSCWNNGQSRTQLSCPAGLHFDSVRSMCEWPDKAVCWSDSNNNLLAATRRLQQEEDQQTSLAFEGHGPASYFAGKFPWSSLQQGIPVWFA